MILAITFYCTTKKKIWKKAYNFETIYFLCEMVINKLIQAMDSNWKKCLSESLAAQLYVM